MFAYSMEDEGDVARKTGLKTVNTVAIPSGDQGDFTLQHLFEFF